MIVYVILAAFAGLFAWAESGLRNKRDMRMFYAVLLIFLLVVGFRYMHGDYGTYEMGYDADIDVGGDAGYFWLQKVFHKMGFSFQAFVFLLTLVSVIAFRQTFRLGPWPLFGMVMILGKIFTLYAMSGIRQYMAMAICWWALSELLLKQRTVTFVVMVLLAYTLHGSAIVFLPILAFRNVTFTYKKAAFLLLLAIVVGAYSMTFFASASKASDFVSDRFGEYVIESQEVEGQSMNLLNYFENFVFLIMAVWVRKRAIVKVPYYDFFLFMFVAYCGFLIVGSEVGIVKRLRDYYAIAYAFLVPAFIYAFRGIKIQKLCRGVMIAYFIFLMFRSLIVFDSGFPQGTYGRMVPYHSIFQKEN